MSSNRSMGRLADLADINPRAATGALGGDTLVSFIPMADVSETGQWIQKQTRRLRDVRNGYTAFQEGDILFAKITPCMENGKGCHAVGLANGIGFGTTEFHVLRPRNGTNARFLFHWTRSEELRREAEAKMTGSAGQRRVPADFFNAYRIPVFDPDEQFRIAEVLDRGDSVIMTSDRLINKLRQINTGLMNDVLRWGLDAQGGVRNLIHHPEQFKDSELGLIPNDWMVVTLKDIGEWLSGGTPSKGTEAFWGGLIPWVTPKDMKQFFIEGSADRITELGALTGTRTIPPNTILFVVRGMILAHTLPVCLTTREVTFNQDVKAIACNDTVLPLYLAYWLISHSASLLNLVTESTHGTKRFEMDDLLRMRLALPKDIKEQERIVEKISANDARIRAEEARRDKLKKIKRGLMQDLLMGRVPVPRALETEVWQ